MERTQTPRVYGGLINSTHTHVAPTQFSLVLWMDKFLQRLGLVVYQPILQSGFIYAKWCEMELVNKHKQDLLQIDVFIPEKKEVGISKSGNLP